MKKTPIKLQRFIYKNFKTQKEFANQIGACPTSVIHWFNGKSLPSADHMIAIYRMTKGKFAPNYWYLRLPKELEQKRINENEKSKKENKNG